MQCPKCGFEQNDQNSQCANCGIFFDKYYAHQSNAINHKKLKSRIKKASQVHNVEPEGLKYLGIGLSVGLLLAVWDGWFIQMTMGILVTLIHELGHTAVAWLFGIPAIPAFDFMHGGGLTINFEQEISIIIALYLLGAFLAFSYRQNTKTLIIISTIGLFHFIAITTDLSDILVLFMGHGTELVIATVFIYRGLTNTSIIHTIERPMYSALGFYIVFHDIAFAWKLINDSGYRVEYEAQKGGYHFGDFSRIAEQYLHTDLSVVASFFLLICLTIPVISFLTWRYQEAILSWAGERLAKQA